MVDLQQINQSINQVLMVDLQLTHWCTSQSRMAF